MSKSKMTKKTEETLRVGIAKFQKILISAKARDLNESDTVAIVTDIFAEVFGFDKYAEVTSELAIRGTYCDLAIKVNGKFEFLAECKAIGIDLKEAHIRQATAYGANKGIEWIILTNGAVWKLYRLRFEQPLSWEAVFSVDLTTANPRDEKVLSSLFAITKEGLAKDAREELYDKQRFINRYTLGLLLQGETVLKAVQKDLRRLVPDIRVDSQEILSILQEDILRRDLLEGEEHDDAKATITKLERRAQRAEAKTTKSAPAETPVPQE